MAKQRYPGPHEVTGHADELHRAMVPENPWEADYLAGRIAISLEECKLALGIGERTMRTALAKGEIPTVMVGGRRLVPVKALERHLEALAYANSGALDAWQAAMVTASTNRMAIARRRAVARRRYLLSKLRASRKNIRTAAGRELAVDSLLALKAEVVELENERAISKTFANDLTVEIEKAEREIDLDVQG